MIKVNEVKELVDFILNKDQSGNSYTPNQFNMLLRRAVDAQCFILIINLYLLYFPNEILMTYLILLNHLNYS